MKRMTSFKDIKMFLKYVLLFISLLCFSNRQLFSQVSPSSLLNNGDFESGVSGTGFQTPSPYIFIGSPPALSGSSNSGDYAITADPNLMNIAFFASSTDHSGSGKMMVVDGITAGGQQRFWKAGNSGGGVGPLIIGSTYTFSYWIKNISLSSINAATTVDIGVAWNNASSVTLVSGSTQVSFPGSTAVWQQVKYNFVPTSGFVNIELYNNITSAVGNDFAIDDIEVLPPLVPLSIRYSILQPFCSNSVDGFVAVYVNGGVPPYTYTIDGIDYPNPYALGYSPPRSGIPITVKDAASPQGVTSIISGPITVGSDPSAVSISSSSASICPGQSTTLNATGSATFSWTASPDDPTLIITSSGTVSVKPLVTTTYTATSAATAKRELIDNGDFSKGDFGFYSDYTSLITNPSKVQKAYGIVANPKIFETDFLTCIDHTSGTGKMLVADGSTTANAKVWQQAVPVTPGTDYNFSYWIQTVATPSPAEIEAQINGQPITGTAVSSTLTAPSTTCKWVEYIFTWNAGSNALAEITLINRNTVPGGNDFALDDISFTTNEQCLVSNSITVTVNSFAFDPLPDTTKVCADSVVLDARAGFTKYLWSNEKKTQGIFVKNPGWYTVTVTNAAGCTASDSSYVGILKAVLNQKDTTICPGNTLSLNVAISSSDPQCNTYILNNSLQNALIGWYPFCGNAIDKGPQGNNGQAIGPVVYAADRYGSTNAAIKFTGNGESVTTKKIERQTINSFSYVTWINTNNSVALPVESINPSTGFGIDLSSSCVIHPTHGFNWNLNNLHTGAGLFVAKNGVFLIEHANVIVSSPLSWSGNLTGWHSVAIVYDNHLPKLFIDGQFVKNGLITPYTVHPSAGCDSFFNAGIFPYITSGFGKGFNPISVSVPSNNFSGSIDDIKIFNRALNPNEIKELFNSDKKKVVWSTGDTTLNIVVKPATSTIYSVSVSDGINTCTDQVNVTIQNNVTAITCGTASNNIVEFNWTAVTNATAYNISYTINNGIPKNGGSITATTYSVNSLTPGDKVTITVTPTGIGCFNAGTATCNTGNCIAPTVNLSSAAGTNNQAICSNTAITNITYNVGGSATGASVTGLPAGITGNFALGVFTINGIPTATGTFNYTITSSGSCTTEATATGTITVNTDATITLSSVASTNNQTICINNVISTITYTIIGGGTGATVTGLPAGVNGAFLNGVFTISGSPSVTGTFNYTVTTVGNCKQVVATGKITVTPDATITLSSAANTNNQTICINNAITNITYNVAGGGTGTSVTGLPAGVTGTFSNGVFTISGTPSATGIFNYTVTTTGTCKQVTVVGTIKINQDASITLSSAVSSDNQSLCINSPIFNIIYKIGGGGSDASVTGLPAGVTGSFLNGDFIISGNPSVPGNFNYTITTTGNCKQAKTIGTIIINPLPSSPNAIVSTIPTCQSPTGTITVDSPQGAAFEYSIDKINFQPGNIFNNLSPGSTQSIIVKNTATGCVSMATIIKVDEIAGLPSIPVITGAANCGPGIVNLNANGAGIINWYSDKELSVIVANGSAYSPVLNNITTFYVTSSNGNCVSKPAEAVATINPIPAKPNLGADAVLCPGDKLFLNPGIYDNYTWQDNTSLPTFNVFESGNYAVTVTSNAGCSNADSITVSLLLSCNDIYFPSAFSPNGVNKTFGPIGTLDPVRNYSLQIYNRYGEIVFSTNNPAQRWDGTYKGKPVGVNSFNWYARYLYRSKINRLRKGTLLVLR